MPVAAPRILNVPGGLVPVGLLVVPAIAGAWLLSHPEHNPALLSPTGHVLVVTTVALLAVAVAALVARTALQMADYTIFLVSVGFLTMAGFFAVHALSTPGVLLSGPGIAGGIYGTTSPSPYGGFLNPYATPPQQAGSDTTFDYDGTVIGLSAFLSLGVPSLLFASSYTGLPAWLSRRLRVRRWSLLVLVLAGLFFYAMAGVYYPAELASLPFSRPPASWILAALSVLLLAFAAWQQTRVYARTRLPTQGALAAAFILLAQAQVLMVVSAFWHVTWWEYHLLMLAADVMALGALFVELDRRRGLDRFVGAEVVQRVVAGNAPRLTGERRVLTLLFADLRDSTSLADDLEAEEVVALANTYVGAIARCVLAHGGSVDKYLGDGLMAIFGLQPDPTDGARDAAASVAAIRREVAAANQAREAEGKRPVGYGIGIHTGNVILGAVGLDQRADFTAMGDAVNTASRLEGLCKSLGVDVVLSQQTADRLPAGAQELRPLGLADVRGKREPLQVFTLERPEAQGT